MTPRSGNKIINIKALSFDLDDTLYDNKPVISKAYRLLFSFLEDNYPKVSDFFSFESFINSAITIKQNHPQIVDLNVIRRLHIKATLDIAGYSINSSMEEQAFEVENMHGGINEVAFIGERYYVYYKSQDEAEKKNWIMQNLHDFKSYIGINAFNI